MTTFFRGKAACKWATLPGILLSWLGAIAFTQTIPSDAGVVVESVGKDSVGDKAGLRVGDVLLGWSGVSSAAARPEQAGGTFTSVFDFNDVQTEEAPQHAASGKTW